MSTRKTANPAHVTVALLMVSIASATASQTGLNGSSAQIAIRVRNSSEYHRFDDVRVEGDLEQYPLTVNTVGEGTVALTPPGGTYPVGTIVQLTANPAPGWTFSGWSGKLSGSGNPASITMTGSKTVAAHFTDVPSSISVIKTANPTGVLETGENVDFVVVVTNASAVDNVTITSLIDDSFGDLSAHCVPAMPTTLAPGETITCSFIQLISGNAGDTHTNTATASGTDDDDNPVSGGGTASVEIEVHPGTIIVQKQTDPDGHVQGFEFSPSWGPNFSLSDDQSNDSGPLLPGTYSVSEISIPTGWSLSNVTVSDGSDPGNIQLDPGERVTVSFANTLNIYTLTYSAGLTGSISGPSPQTVEHGSDGTTVTADPAEGYHFVDWSDGSTDNPRADMGLTADITVTANFAINTYTLTYGAGPNGSIEGTSPQTVEHGTDGAAVTAAANPTQRFVDWSDGSTENPRQDLAVTGDVTVTANFEIDSYTVSASAGAGGSVSPAGDTQVNHGSDLVLTATPLTGYQVNTWSVDGVYAQTGDTSFTLSNVTTEHSVDVTFFKIHYKVSATAGPGGSISPADASVAHEDSQIFTAIPDLGYQVDEWSLDGSVVQTGGATYEVGPVDEEHTVHVTFKPTLSYFLGLFDFEDEGDYESGIISNNAVSVRPVGLGLDPDDLAMELRKQARAKGTFIDTGTDEVLIRFEYLFTASDVESTTSDVELVVYVSDSPLLLAHDDPTRAQHYFEVARLAAPPFDLPGSPGSERFAVFQEIVSTGNLDFTQGLYIELELIGLNTGGTVLAGLSPRRLTGINGGSSVYVDDWSIQVQCYGICLDINWDNFVDEADFLTIISGCGLSAGGDRACLEGSFSTDGYMDSYDVSSWDWAMNSDQRLLNYCGLPLTGGSGGLQLGSMRMLMAQGPGEARPLTGFRDDLSDLLILGKRGPADASSKLRDGLYAFTRDGQFTASVEPASDRGNIKLIQGADGEIYQLNSETGLVRSESPYDVIIPPGSLELAPSREPRFNTTATVYIGIQDLGADSFGRPILDVAMDANYVYVVPVVVSPADAQTYTAAAKLQLLPSASPPYELVEVYDDPPLLHDNQYRDGLREIELDASGNVYVLNVNALNESDMLWRYQPDGTVDRLDLGRPDGGMYVPAPIALHVSKATGMLYLASALLDPVDPESTTVYGFSTLGDIALETSIAVPGLQHVTSMAEDSQSGTLWVAGFYLLDPPLYPNPTQPAFYYAQLAKIPSDGSDVELLPLYAPVLHDLSLPMSILWTGPSE